MANFDFVADDSLRTSLDSDAAEMSVCLEAKAYKAVHVLAGSVLEAILVDHLDSIGYSDPKGKTLLELNLGQLIAAARGNKVLSKRAADLASVVQDYRNLIHPGRLARLSERIDANTADIARALVEVVATEISDLRRDTYGYTAQQVANKVENDSSSMSILGDLLRETKPREMESLLVSVIPARYVELAGRIDPDDDPEYQSHIQSVLGRLRRAYRAAMDAAPEDVRQRTVAAYARLLREEVSEFDIVTRESGLFRAADLRYMSESDASMAKRHLFSRVDRLLEDSRVEALTGIGLVADPTELAVLVDAAVKFLTRSDVPRRRGTISGFLQRLYSEAPDDRKSAVPARLEDWESTFNGKNPDLEIWLSGQKESMTMDLDQLPF